MLTILLTRHGHTDKSEPEQYLGQRIDARLTDRGRTDARRLAERLADVPIDRVLSSSAMRAADTARILAGGRPVELDERLIELDYGAWEGLTAEEIDARFPGERERYDADPSSHEVGGAESGREVAERLLPVVDELVDWGLRDEADSTCLVVAHSSVNRVLLAMCLGVPLAHYRRRFQQDWANLTVLRWADRDEGPMLLLAKDVSHIRGLRGPTWD